MFLPAPPSEYFPRIYNLGTVSTFIWYISLHDYFAKKNSCSLKVFSLFDLIFLTHTIFLCFPYLGSPEKPPTVVPWHSPQSELRMMPSQLDTRKAPGVREKLENRFRRPVSQHVLLLMSLMSLHHPLLAQLPITPAGRGHAYIHSHRVGLKGSFGPERQWMNN